MKEKLILSIQSHVAYGYVGNKAAIYPLQMMGFDVMPVNTVQFSNHTGYGKFTGQIFDYSHIESVLGGIKDIINFENCHAVLSGYTGNKEIADVIKKTAKDFKMRNQNIIYLCDPVMGDVGRGIFVKSEIVDFFKNHIEADIITPNHFEAEILSNMPIKSLSDAKQAADILHRRGIKIVIITSLNIDDLAKDKIHIFMSNNNEYSVSSMPLYNFDIAKNGTGDLFSALFLGCYLEKYDAQNALTKSHQLMDKVMMATLVKNTRELRVIDIDYRNVP